MKYSQIVAAFFLAQSANAEIVDNTILLSDLEPINVKVHDSATGGCWTNISETRSYAYDQLELTGVTTRANDNLLASLSEGATLGIYINAFRSTNGHCIGSIDVNFEALARGKNNKFGVFVYSERQNVIQHQSNLNMPILDKVKDAIKEWQSRN